MLPGKELIARQVLVRAVNDAEPRVIEVLDIIAIVDLAVRVDVALDGDIHVPHEVEVRICRCNFERTEIVRAELDRCGQEAGCLAIRVSDTRLVALALLCWTEGIL